MKTKIPKPAKLSFFKTMSMLSLLMIFVGCNQDSNDVGFTNTDQGKQLGSESKVNG